MSHVAKIDIEIKDLDSLATAAKALGLEFVAGQQTYRWFGKHVGDYPLPAGFRRDDLGKCEHAIKVPGSAIAYEIGVVTRRDGKPGYTLLWDFWAGGYGLQKLVGDNGNKLKQEYALAVSAKQLMRQGFRVNRVRMEDGRVQLRATK